jgi:hypothetical protein
LNPKRASPEKATRSKGRAQAQELGGPFIFELVNTAFDVRSTVVITPEFQYRVTADGDTNPIEIAVRIKELGANGPPCEFKLLRALRQSVVRSSSSDVQLKFSDAVDLINGLPLANLIEPALEGLVAPHDVRQRTLFQKPRKWLECPESWGQGTVHLRRENERNPRANTGKDLVKNSS